MDTTLGPRVARVFAIVSGAALLASALAGCILLLEWIRSPSTDGALVTPYESFLLYYEHYDWVAAPFLQAFRVSSISAVFLAASRLIPRIFNSWKVWVPGLVALFAIQVTIFNMVVNVMNGSSTLYGVYLAMSWFQPWLLLTLGDVGSGLYSTGGLALIFFALSTVALFTARRSQGLWTSFVETSLFVSVVLLVFELGILVYMPEWWGLQVSQVQSTIGVPWITNRMLYSLTMLSVPVSCCLRMVLWRASRNGISRRL
jgi:hypothetical protein